MPVTRMLDRIRDQVEAEFAKRCSADDHIEFDVALGIVHVAEDGNEDCRTVTTVSVYASLAMPEHGEHAVVTEHVLVGARYMEEEHEVADVVNDIWTGLCSTRMLGGLDEESMEKAAQGDEPTG